MERRRFRSSRETWSDDSLFSPFRRAFLFFSLIVLLFTRINVRDPKNFIGGLEIDYPFQLKYQKLIENQSVKIQSDSVNCISLGKDPQYAEDFLIVSPFITTSGSSENLSAAQTTLLEGRPLLPALVW